MQYNVKPDEETVHTHKVKPNNTPTLHTGSLYPEAKRRNLCAWFQDMTFSADFLAPPWSRPIFGYLIAILGQVVVVTAIAKLAQVYAAFHLHDALVLLALLVVILAALGWGIGPSLIATLVGAGLLIFFLFPPYFSLAVSRVEDMVSTLLFIGIGLTISILTSQVQRARQAAQALSQRLEAIIEALPDQLEERLRSALQNSPIAVYQQDRDLRYTWIHNPLSTITPQSILGKTDADFVQQDDANHLTQIKRRVLSSGQGFREEVQTTSDAGVKVIDLTIEPLRDMSGAIVGVSGTAIDITERKQAEEERTHLLARAQRSEYRFQKLFEANLIGLLEADQEKAIEANDAFLEIVGYSRKDLESGLLRWSEMTPSEYHHLTEQAIADLMARGQCLPFEKEYLRKDGSRVPVFIGTVLVEQEPLHWISFVLNLSEQKRLERETRTHSRELETLFEAITDSVMVYDSKGYIRQMNTTARTQLKHYLRPDEFTQSAYERASRVKPRSAENQRFAPEQVPVLRMLQGETLMGAQAVDVLVKTFDGDDLWLNMSGTPLRDEQGQVTGAISLARDVTERRQLEQRTHNALEALLEMATVIVQGSEGETEAGANAPGATWHARHEMQRMAELTREVLGCERLSITSVEPGTELLRPLAVVGLAADQEQQWWQEQEEREVHLSDGTDATLIARLRANEILLVDLTQPPYSDQPNPYGIRQLLTAPMVLGTRLLGFLALDYGGREHTYLPEEIEITRAVTKLATLVMERDRLLAEAAIARANELAAYEASRLKDEFIGIASHELRTPMTTLKASLQLAQRQLRRFMQQQNGNLGQPLGQLLQLLERSERQLGRQQRLVSDLLDVSRIETGRMELHLEICDLVAVVREAIEDQEQLTPTRTIKLETPGHAVLVTADQDRVSQVVSNYLSNALKYSEPDQPISLWLEIKGTEARIAVRDQGPGLSQDQLQHIWKRFYRVPGIEVKSGSGVGLGLGLYISRTIIEQLAGAVGVESEQGNGSTFWFTLPLANTEQRESQSQ